MGRSEQDNLGVRSLELGNKFIFEDQGKRAVLFACGAAGRPLIVLNCYSSDEGESVRSELAASGAPKCDLLAVSGLDWDRDMSPWPCPPVFAGGEAYAGGADAYLAFLTERIVPWAMVHVSGVPAFVGIAGYSLGGLFALYSLYRCDVFDRAASMSGSLWYPDFLSFAQEQDFVRHPERVYLSVGDRESKTRNPFLKTVQENTEAIASLYRAQGIDVSFELNPGNHFNDPEKRTAKGIMKLVRSEQCEMRMLTH